MLKPDGKTLIHSIVRPDIGTTNRWIDTHIFPGGYIPRGSEVVAAIEQSGLEIERIYYHGGENYQRTLQEWLTNLTNEKESITQAIQRNLNHKNSLLSDETLTEIAEKEFRIWEFYLGSIQSIFHPLGGRYSIAQYVVSAEAKTKRQETKRLFRRYGNMEMQ